MFLFIDSKTGLLPLAETSGGGLMGFLATGGYVMLLIVLSSMAVVATVVLARAPVHQR